MNFKVSVIVSVYNVSKYLRNCLDSIVNQSLKEIEIIIIINDASPDPQDEIICLEYKEKDNRIKYIKHSSNKGLGGARNTGILSSSAPYLTFIDSDDFIHKDLCKDFYEAAIGEGADVVCGDIARVFHNNIIDKLEPIKYAGLFTYGDLKEDPPFDKLTSSACCKLYKKSLLIENNVFFPECYYYEDTVFNSEIQFFLKFVFFIQKVYYYYNMNPNSITRQKINKKHVESMFFFTDRLKELLCEFGIYEKYKAEYMSKTNDLFFLYKFPQDREIVDFFVKNFIKRDYPLGSLFYTLNKKDKKRLFDCMNSIFTGKSSTKRILKRVFKKLGIFNLAKKLYWIIKPIILKFKGVKIE